MNTVQIVLIIVLAVVVAALLFFVIKNMIMPKRVDAIPHFLKQGKSQNAIKIAKQIIAKDPNNYLAHYYLGKAYILENKSELAIIEYKFVDEHALFGAELNEIDFRKEFSSLLLKYKHQNEALKNFLLLTKLEPRNAENYFNVGLIYENNNRFDLALGFMQKAAYLDNKHAKAHAEIGMMFYRTKQYSEAKK